MGAIPEPASGACEDMVAWSARLLEQLDHCAVVNDAKLEIINDAKLEIIEELYDL
ncbi:MAG: hypothetical protein ABW066_06735 [Sedimenticola sp.]